MAQRWRSPAAASPKAPPPINILRTAARAAVRQPTRRAQLQSPTRPRQVPTSLPRRRSQFQTRARAGRARRVELITIPEPEPPPTLTPLRQLRPQARLRTRNLVPTGQQLLPGYPSSSGGGADSRKGSLTEQFRQCGSRSPSKDGPRRGEFPRPGMSGH